MRIIITNIVFFFFVVLNCQAQTDKIDSLKQLLRTEEKDTSRVKLLHQLALIYSRSKPDTAILLAQEGQALAKKSNFIRGEAQCLTLIGIIFKKVGNYPKALEFYLQALKKFEEIRYQPGVGSILGNIGNIYGDQGDYRQSINYTLKQLALAKSINHQPMAFISLLNLGDDYASLDILDSALDYTKQSYALAFQMKYNGSIGLSLNNLGNIYFKKGDAASAIKSYQAGIPYLTKEMRVDFLCETYLGIAKVYQKKRLIDSSLYYSKLALANAQEAGFINYVLNASIFLKDYYVSIENIDSAFVYQSRSIVAKDSLFSQEKLQQVQNLAFAESVRQQDIKDAKNKAKIQLKFNFLFGGLFTLIVVTFLLYRNNRHKQKANILLEKQKGKVEKMFSDLKLTQAQLVQSEKMASLGELTAGIAHEIQNPLNFVNNFSDVNKELLIEMKDEMNKGNTDDAKAIANDVIENEEKINHHGKRADAIVKNMLQHSRSSSGAKEPTDVNLLADEYLRLSFHGLRAKNKSFNPHFKTDFDNSIGKINIIPQDIGRVILNLINNAFYAVDEKKKQMGDGYEPTVSVSTRKANGKVEITVSDNGNGIPQRVLDKIFQPFFTTKPTGQGTGLGLSLSYDIVKAHGGEIKVETKESDGTSFIIHLPVV